jgi:hypothetical protein
MIDVEQAVEIAVKYCGKLFGHLANEFRLEEVELSSDDKHWLITIGFSEPVPLQPETVTEALQGMMRQRRERKYKIVDVDAESGKVRAVKIRSPLERVS